MLKHKHKITFASFDENCTQTRIVSNTPFKWRGNVFLVHGTKIDLPQFSCILHVLSMLS